MSVDPVAWYVYLGDTIADGLVAWITVGINTSASYDVNYAATWTGDGGVETETDTSGGGGDGTLPTGIISGISLPTGIP